MVFPLPDKDTFEKLYPSSLRLKQVQAVHRHGERSPVFPGGATFTKCQLTPFLHAVFYAMEMQNLSQLPLYNQPHHESLPSFAKVVFEGAKPDFSFAIKAIRDLTNDGTCFNGQLTDKGKNTMETMGASLRKLYIDMLKFLQPTLDSSHYKDVYLRSSDIARTLESLQYLVNGLYPVSTRDSENLGEVNLKVHIRTDETLYPLRECKYLDTLSKQLRKVLLAQDNRDVESIFTRFNQFGSGYPKGNILDFNYIHSLYDNLICLQAHDEPLPAGITSHDIIDLENMEVKYWWNIFNNTGVARMAIGRFVDDLKKQFEDSILNPETSVKFAVYSGHDSTVGPLLSAFRIFDGRFPPFGSIITFELFEDAFSSKTPMIALADKKDKQYYIRVLYEGQPKFLPICEKLGNHHPNDSSLCTWEAFKEAMNRVIPDDWDKECSSSWSS